MFSLHNGDFLSGLRSHFGLVLLDLCSINLSLQVHQLPVIFTLHIGHLRCLLIFQSQFLVTVLLYVILQLVLKLGLLFKCLSKLGVDEDVSDAAVLKADAEVLKLGSEIFDHLGCHFSLEIENLTQPDSIHEGSNSLVYLCIQKLVKTTRSQLVDEILDSLLILRHSKGEKEINIDVGIVLCGAIMNL